jgi:hypothetical protein
MHPESRPELGDPIAVHPDDVDADADPEAGALDAEERADVGGPERPANDDPVAEGDDVVVGQVEDAERAAHRDRVIGYSFREGVGPGSSLRPDFVQADPGH